MPRLFILQRGCPDTRRLWPCLRTSSGCEIELTVNKFPKHGLQKRGSIVNSTMEAHLLSHLCCWALGLSSTQFVGTGVPAFSRRCRPIRLDKVWPQRETEALESQQFQCVAGGYSRGARGTLGTVPAQKAEGSAYRS